MGSHNLRRIAPGLHLLRLDGPAHFLNAYLWLGSDGVTLIDTGWRSSADTIEAALAELGYSRSELRRIVLTHFHDDHSGSAAELASWGAVEVIAGTADAPFIEGTERGPIATLTTKEKALAGEVSTPPHGPACRVDHTVGHGDLLDFAGGAKVLDVPGHTPGSIAIYLPDASAILTGDAVAELNGQVILGIFNTDRAAAVRSLRVLAETGADIAGFGHGEPCLDEAHARIWHAIDLFAENT